MDWFDSSSEGLPKGAGELSPVPDEEKKKRLIAEKAVETATEKQREAHAKEYQERLDKSVKEFQAAQKSSEKKPAVDLSPTKSPLDATAPNRSKTTGGVGFATPSQAKPVGTSPIHATKATTASPHTRKTDKSQVVVQSNAPASVKGQEPTWSSRVQPKASLTKTPPPKEWVNKIAIQNKPTSDNTEARERYRSTDQSIDRSNKLKEIRQRGEELQKRNGTKQTNVATTEPDEKKPTVGKHTDKVNQERIRPPASTPPKPPSTPGRRK